MSKILRCLKSAAERIPEPIGRVVALVPFSWRLGPQYMLSRRKINQFSTLASNEQRDYIYSRVREIVEHAYNQTRFYRSHYDKHGFTPEALQNFEDIQKIPIVTKADLRQWPLEKRSHTELDRMKLNTGGTSGNPLHFYVDRNAFAREWAHMHEVWESFGYETTDLKLTLRGANIGDKPYRYNAVHNEYIVNAYKALESIEDELLNLARERKIRYIHGYPSAIYEFARYCKSNAPEIVEMLGETLQGVLLGSEYPAPVYRNTIEDVLKVHSLSWFGHTEMAIFAPERRTQYLFEPMQTYGFCEAIPDEEGDYRLVGTSYDNTASPFIRYDSGDRVGNIAVEGGILRSFRITAGRVGEFVVDQAGHRISLTALVFGRHHEIFEYAEFVQVRQQEPGHMTILVTPEKDGEIQGSVEWSSLFDDSNVEMEIEFQVLERPMRTGGRKVKLLVESADA